MGTCPMCGTPTQMSGLVEKCTAVPSTCGYTLVLIDNSVPL